MSLGSRWDEEKHRETVRADPRPAHPNFHLVAENYAAKVAAETIRGEPPTPADLSDEALLEQLALCSRPARPSEVAMVREAFISAYGPQALQ